MQTNRFEFQSSPDGARGDLGFKLSGPAADDSGKFARVWLRRKRSAGRHVWARYLAPVPQSAEWEVRLHEVLGTGGMTLLEFDVETLDRLAKEYTFPSQPETADQLKAVEIDDPVYNLIRDWAIKLLSAA